MTRATRKTALGSVLIVMIALAAGFAKFLQVQDPNTMDLAQRFSEPSTAHPFGLDQNGSDVFSQVLHGARVSLTVSFSVVFLSALIGVAIGSLAGYKGGLVDLVMMRILDMFYAFPGFLLALTFVAVLGPSLKNLILAMCVTGWTSYARLVRGEVLHLKTREYVIGATALGADHARILLRHILPNLLGLLSVQMTFGMAGTIITESGLSFLGLGAPSTTPTWGALLNSGRRFLTEAPHISIFPGLAILMLVLGFNLLGDGLRDRFNPKERDA